MPMSDYLANKVLDHVFGGTTFTQPATVYLQMDTTKYAADGSGGVAMIGTGAARKAITSSAAASRQKASSALITFFSSAPSDAVGQPSLKAFSIWDALTSGNMLWYDDLTAQLVLATGSTVQVAAGQELLQLPTT